MPLVFVFRHLRVRLWVVVALLGVWLAAPVLAEAPVGKGRDPEFNTRSALDTSQAAIGRTLDDYTFTNPAGESVALSSFLGKPLIISLIYTSCYHTCSISTRFLASVVDKARETFGDENFHVVSIGFDSRFDTPKAMASFARQQGIEKQPNWRVLSASPDTIIRLAHQLGFIYAPSPKGFDHLVQATIVDAKGVIYRQVYGESFQTQLLTEPLRTLILGTPPSDSETPVEELVRRVRFFCTTYDPSTDGYRFDYSLFIGLFCGGSVILITFFLLVREWWRSRKQRRI
ncbi:MAG: SCO family protein [Magnetococcales bacterium]|nr:SCO family protein [Magnetococcales bacterium]